jgi:hypothetical protein
MESIVALMDAVNAPNDVSGSSEDSVSVFLTVTASSSKMPFSDVIASRDTPFAASALYLPSISD